MPKPRIIAGTAKGQYLDTPTKGTRPSPVRLREALFSMLEFEQRGSFLDLFSGSGAIGLEAASRAWQVTCIDLSSAAVKILKNNSRRLKLDANIIKADALKFIKNSPEKYDIVFAAPPYPLDLVDIFQKILDADIASSDGFYIFQYPTKLAMPLSIEAYKIKRYGFNTVAFYKK